MTLNSNSFQEIQGKTPVNYLKKACRGFGCFIVSLAMFIGTGTAWLFQKHPHLTWLTILIGFVIYSFFLQVHLKTERDAYSKEAAILMDSIDRLNMEPVNYVTLSNTPAQAIRPTFKDSTK